MKTAATSTILLSLLTLFGCEDASKKTEQTYQGQPISHWIQLADDTDHETRKQAVQALEDMYLTVKPAREKYQAIYQERFDLVRQNVAAHEKSPGSGIDWFSVCVVYGQVAEMQYADHVALLSLAKRIDAIIPNEERQTYRNHVLPHLPKQADP